MDISCDDFRSKIEQLGTGIASKGDVLLDMTAGTEDPLVLHAEACSACLKWLEEKDLPPRLESMLSPAQDQCVSELQNEMGVSRAQALLLAVVLYPEHFPKPAQV